MSEQRFGWNYFENEIVIGDKQDKKRMIVIVLSNFMDIPYNKKSFDEIVTLLNVKEDTIQQLEKKNQRVYDIIEDGGVLLTRKQLLDVIGEDKCDMFFREQETSNKLQKIKDLLSEADLFSDKATEHDIIAYSEMLDFDNKDAYSIACAIAMIKKELNDE